VSSRQTTTPKLPEEEGRSFALNIISNLQNSLLYITEDHRFNIRRENAKSHKKISEIIRFNEGSRRTQDSVKAVPPKVSIFSSVLLCFLIRRL
jgi:hypothetical protein